MNICENNRFILLFLMGFLFIEILRKMTLAAKYTDKFTNPSEYYILNKEGSGGKWPDQMLNVCDVKQASDVLGLDKNYGCTI
tara:strand:+ start:1078 stop:1323 length:246 start_codon:yes stop_codon:yes gene_type:complete